jgi:electron transfer flavoprotein alpha subunit
MDSWIIVTEAGPVAGMAAAARSVGGAVTAAVVGPRALAESTAACGCDAVQWVAIDDGVPAEAVASQVADLIAGASPRLVLALDDPAGRALLAAAAVKLGAALLNSVPQLSVEGDDLVVRRPAVEGKVVETLVVPGALAGVFDGEDADAASVAPAAITEVAPSGAAASMRIVETTVAAGEAAGLQQAERVVSLGRGVRKRDDIALVEGLAAAAHAKVACTLPICDDMRWYDESHVVGTSTQQIAPDLYIAVGVSGQPQHMSGVRAAKVIVAINNDPEATIFKKSHYGILGDLYEIVPALTKAFEQA